MSHIYVIESGAGMCKVGVAIDPRSRLSQLKTGHPHTLEIAHAFPVRALKAYEIEKSAHALMHEKRMTGEWFDVTADIAAQAVRDAIDLVDPPKVDENDRSRPLPDSDRERLYSVSQGLWEAQAAVYDIVSHRHYSPNEVDGIIQLIRDVADKLAEPEDDV